MKIYRNRAHGAQGAQGGSRVGRAPHCGGPPGGVTMETETETETETEATTNIPTSTTPHAPVRQAGQGIPIPSL